MIRNNDMANNLNEPSASVETKRALELGEEQFRRSFEDAPIGMMIVETDSSIRHANRALCEMLGYSATELKNKFVKELSHPDDLNIGRKEVQEIVQGGRKTFNFEKRYISKFGDIVWALLNGTMIRNHNEQPSHMVCHVQNITDRKKIDEALSRHQTGLTCLHEISANLSLNYEKKIESVLNLGAQIFDLPIGMVGEIINAGYQAKFAVGPNSSELIGVPVNFENSYCYHTNLKEAPIGYHNVAESPLSIEPCYERLRFGAYLGAPLFVGSKVFGTVCFVGREARSRPFDEYEITFLKHMSQWIGNEVHRHDIETKRQLEFNQYKALTEKAGDAIFVRDEEGNFIEVNETACDRLGYTREEILQMKVWDISIGTNAEFLKRNLINRKNGGLNVVRNHHRRKDGSLFPIEASVARYDWSGENRYIITARDITDQRRIESELVERGKLQELLGRISIAANEAQQIEEVLETSLTAVGKYTGWEVGHALLYPDAQAKKLQSASVWYFTDKARFGSLVGITNNQEFKVVENLLDTVLQKEKVLWREIGKGKKKGRRTDDLIKLGLKTSVKVPITVGKKIVGALEFFGTDFLPEQENLSDTLFQIGTQVGRVVEREWANENLVNAKQFAEIGSRTKSEFLANMSHELRSPLTAILGFSEAMRSEIYGPVGNEKYTEYADNILKSAEHLHAIINDVLDVSAIEAGKLNMHEEEFDISDTVHAVVRMIKPRAEDAHVKLINNISSPVPLIFGDERRLKQVIVNLLSNSIRFTPENGLVELSWAKSKSSGIEFKISDNGIGMDQAGIEKALSVFGQVESDFTRNYDGTGLGLPLSKGLMEAHGGMLNIESALGQGTTVILTLPADRLIEN